ncbi:hypothetical protein B5M42_001650 [Paenibacillus athensensis]|uniref:Uncharacterized protein n=1 Tax=Paenibacillus athensensis TaxID=1967502 RepID=A0A4Y8QCG5_9BACL|nr:hypothetical protein [Paenibacillus athensensis]MCD1257540.1 hypothetical protein [Paenibacillus athensensis]
MIYGTKLLDTDTELFAAALSQTSVYVWSLDTYGVFFQVGTGIIEKFTPDYVRVRSEQEPGKRILYPRESCEFSIRSV